MRDPKSRAYARICKRFSDESEHRETEAWMTQSRFEVLSVDRLTVDKAVDTHTVVDNRRLTRQGPKLPIRTAFYLLSCSDSD